MAITSAEPRLEWSRTAGCLLGLALSPAATRAAESLTARLLEVGGAQGVRVIAPDELHLTVRYLDVVSEERVTALCAHLPRLAERHPLDPVMVSGLGGSPSLAEPTIVLASVPELGERLAGLRADVDATCRALGFAPRVRPWRPHVSLARLQGATPGGPITEFVRQNRDRCLGPADTSRLILFVRDTSQPTRPLRTAISWALGLPPTRRP